MRSAEGVEHRLEGSYREIAGPSGWFLRMHSLMPQESRARRLWSVTFIERGGKTEMTLRQSGFKSAESRDGHRLGWTSAFDVLGEYLTQYVKKMST